jgi:hypothetical protein
MAASANDIPGTDDTSAANRDEPLHVKITAIFHLDSAVMQPIQLQRHNPVLYLQGRMPGIIKFQLKRRFHTVAVNQIAGPPAAERHDPQFTFAQAYAAVLCSQALQPGGKFARFHIRAGKRKGIADHNRCGRIGNGLKRNKRNPRQTEWNPELQ